MLQNALRLWSMALIGLVVAPLMLAQATIAAPAPSGALSPDKLKALITGLGYDVPDEKNISLDVNGKYTLNIVISPSDDQTNLYIYINLGKMTDVQVGKIAPKLLQFNGEHKEYFSVRHNGADDNVLYINGQIRSQSVNAQVVRTALDDLRHEAEKTDDMWNVELWK